MRIIYILISVIVFYTNSEEQVENLCQNMDAQQSCGQCIKSHSDCAWCLDPHSTFSNRCQLKSKITNDTCNSQFVYFPQASQVKVQQNLPLKSFHHDGKTLIRLQPQATSVKIMPGTIGSIHFKYFHQSDSSRKTRESETMVIQTSDISQTPISLKFFIFCEGEKKATNSCQVTDGETVDFQIDVLANSCSDTGDITLSVGVLGQRTIAGVYITTVCGCECEKHPEINSRLCHQKGHLVCGQCVCDQTRGGSKCECPLENYGVSTAAMLDGKCKFNSTSLECSGFGTCHCGQCQCNKQTISGEFCECDNKNCPSSNDKICSGNGICDCGSCKCEQDWENADCSCSKSLQNCSMKREKATSEENNHETISAMNKENNSLSEKDKLETKIDESDKDIQKISFSSQPSVICAIGLVFIQLL